MKKSLVTLLFIPIITYSQSFNTDIYYGDQLCGIAQMALNPNNSLSFTSSSQLNTIEFPDSFSVDLANTALNKILFQIGASRDRFIIQACPNIKNALAVQLGGVRYILYDQNFIVQVADNFENSNWGEIFILAHEVGHHINNHSVDLLLAENINSESKLKQREQELDADLFAAFIISRLGGSLEEIVSVIENISNNINDQKSSHPNLEKRLKAVKVGFERGIGNNTLDFYNSTPLQTAEEYFNRAILNELKENYDAAIYDYNKAIEIDPFNHNALYRMGVAKKEKGDYFGSIKNHTKLSDIYPQWYKPYSEIGTAYYEIGDYNSAIRFLDTSIQKKNRAIEFKDYNNFSESDENDSYLDYFNRGQAYLKVRMYEEAFNDFKKVIELNKNNHRAYSQLSQIYILNNEYYLALSSINKAIEYNPSGSKNYFNKAVILDIIHQSTLDEIDDFSDEEDKVEILKNALDFKLSEIENYNLAIKFDNEYAVAYRSRGVAFEYIANRIVSYDNQLLDYYLQLSEKFNIFHNKSLKKNNESAYDYYMLSACNDWVIASSLGNTDSTTWISDYCN
jgi:tetratricopeptide (TPR) repeat protein